MLYDRVKQIAHEKNIPICKLESDLGFSQGSVSKWNGTSPAWDKVQKVANYLKVDIRKLTG